MKNLHMLIFMVLLFFSRVSEAQVGLGGFSAVLTIPTARMLPDGHAAIGFGYIPKPYALYEGPDHNNVAYFATIGFLPFVEVGIRATLSINTDYPSIGDRMLSVRARLLQERERSPALAIGLHDIAGLLDNEEGTNNYFTALYFVATKAQRLSERWHLETSLGYGVDWIAAPSHEFDNLFGGMSLGFHEFLFVKGEYDAHRVNLGLGMKLKEFLSANAMLMNGNRMAFGGSLKTRL